MSETTKKSTTEETKTTTPKTESKETKTETKTETTTKTNGGRHPLYLDMQKWSLRKVAFLTIVALGVLHLVSGLLAIFDLQSIVSGLQAVASAIATAVVAVLSWSYAAERTKEWKVIYFVCLLVVVLGMIVPLVF